MLSCEVPGVSIARSIQRREATGRSWICCVDTAVATSERVTSTIGDSPVTVTVSDSAAGLSAKWMIAVWSMISTMSGRVSVLKPLNSVDTEYRPGGSDGRRNSPAASVTPVRVRPLSRLRAVIVAPGMIAPLESLTVPLICAFCAKADGAHAIEMRNAANPTTQLRMPASLTLFTAGRRRRPLRRRFRRHDGTNSNRCQRHRFTGSVFLDAVHRVMAVAEIFHARHQVGEARLRDQVQPFALRGFVGRLGAAREE